MELGILCSLLAANGGEAANAGAAADGTGSDAGAWTAAAAGPADSETAAADVGAAAGADAAGATVDTAAEEPEGRTAAGADAKSMTIRALVSVALEIGARLLALLDSADIGEPGSPIGILHWETRSNFSRCKNCNTETRCYLIIETDECYIATEPTCKGLEVMEHCCSVMDIYVLVPQDAALNTKFQWKLAGVTSGVVMIPRRRPELQPTNINTCVSAPLHRHI